MANQTTAPIAPVTNSLPVLQSIDYTKFQSKVPPALPPVDTTINAAGLGNSSTKLPNNSSVDTSHHDNFAAKVGSAIGTIQPPQDTDEKDTTDPVATENQGFKDKIMKLLGLQADKDSETAQIKEDVGLNEKKKAVNDLESKILATQKSYRDQADQIRANSTGMLESGVNARLNDLSRKSNNDLANLAIQYKVANGDYTSAKDIADAKVTAEFGDITNQINAYEKMITINNEGISPTEKAKIQANAAALRAQVTDLSAAKRTAYGTAIKAGASSAVYSAIESATTPNDAYRAVNGLAPKSTTGASTKKTLSDAGYSYSEADVETAKQELLKGFPDNTSGQKFNPAGADGFVDPGAYIALMNNWTNDGGSIQGFAKEFSAQKYINPASYPLIPSAIRPNTDASDGGFDPLNP